MSTETNKAIIRRYIDQMWNNGRLDLAEEFFVENVVPHGVQAVLGLEVLELVKNGIATVRAAFPDLQITLHDLIAEGDLVVNRWSGTATHQEELMGMPGTGKKITMSGIGIHRLVNARIVELWSFTDNLSLMQQLGAIPMVGESR
jgi:steroid delta-isomerase-like uncharacterized protein